MLGNFTFCLPISIDRMPFHLSPRQAPPLPPPPSKEYLEENLAPRMLAVDGTIFGLAILCVLLRIYVRAIVLKTVGIDGMFPILLGF
jgi:hypothetical protein